MIRGTPALRPARCGGPRCRRRLRPRRARGSPPVRFILAARAAQIYWNRLPIGWIAGPKVATDLPVSAAGFYGCGWRRRSGCLAGSALGKCSDGPPELNVYHSKALGSIGPSTWIPENFFRSRSAPPGATLTMTDSPTDRPAGVDAASQWKGDLHQLLRPLPKYGRRRVYERRILSHLPIPTGRAPSFIPTQQQTSTSTGISTWSDTKTAFGRSAISAGTQHPA